MPAVAKAMAADLSALQPAHEAYFQARLQAFNRSLAPWRNAIAQFKAKYPGTTAATTEPVADYLLTAMGITNLTPFRFQADIMNGADPAPQDIALENSLFAQHKVKLFAYNQQVTDALTTSIRDNALKAGVPVVGVYETMPTGYDYQSLDARRGERHRSGRLPARSRPRNCDDRPAPAPPPRPRSSTSTRSASRWPGGRSSTRSASPSVPGSSPG